ncbi:MAG TPA: MBL fold metallo-hydrolase [Candidatus Nanoarchaeia archaeon]|nr:MBL fold metallo-hydrolase [Candidatus Nanoarchaeia archaeon]
MARLVFLGTAGSSTVARKQLRSSGGFILQMEELQFHFDPGPGTLRKAQECGISLQHTTALLVSHSHLNHCNDLNLMIEAMTHEGIERRGLLLASKSVVQPQDEAHPILTKHHQQLLEKIIPFEKDRKIGIELIEINALPVDHTDATAIGFKIFCPKFTLSYPGDTAITPELLESLVGSDVLVLNVPYPGKQAQGKNLDTQAAVQIVSHVKPKLVILTHFGMEMLKADPFLEARDVQRITGVQTIAAKDGLAIALGAGDISQAPVKGF